MAKTFKMVDGDIYFDVNGRLVEITGFEKVSQDIAEALLTDLDIDRDFGSELNAVSTNPTINIGRQQVASFVRDAIDRLRKIQRTNTTTTRDEEIASIDAIEVYKNDQTEITFGLAVSTSNGNSAESSVSLNSKTARLNHLLAPSITEENQIITNELLGRKAVTSGETK